MSKLLKYQFPLLFSLSLVFAQHAYSSIPPMVESFEQAEMGEEFSGGGATSKKQGKRSFLQPGANLAFDKQLDFKIGESIFDKLWVFSPSSTSASDGLGPLHNARSCMACHIRGGRGHVPNLDDPTDNAISMLMRLSIAPQNEQHRSLLASGKVPSIEEPNYGNQLQDFALQGMEAEGKIQIKYTEKEVHLNGGTVVKLRQPDYSITDLQYGELHPSIMTSVRVANPMIGLGLLEAIDEQDMLTLADPNDEDNDGISGRVNKVWDEANQKVVIGKFGWKAGAPNIDQQNGAAFSTDMGLSTALFKDNHFGDCTIRQMGCRNAPDGRTSHLGGIEVAPQMSDALLTFVQNIGVPKRLNVNDKSVLVGKEIFYQTGCTGCHQPKFITKKDTATNVELSGQLIWPYSDMLLHDMGEGLADHRPEFEATGTEWRTTPLWGIGKTAVVNRKTEFLHDGRARSLLEAILWHGGEAEESRDKVVNMTDQERALLIKFLESL